MSEPQWKCPFKTSLFLTCKILPFYFFFQLQSLRLFFFKSASECKLSNSGNNKTGTVWGHAWMIWCQFDVRRGDNIGPEAWILWFTSLHTLFTCDYFKFESDRAKSTFETTKQCLHINDHPWHPNHQEGKLIELVISLTILMEFMWYDALQLNSILIFHYLTCCI